MKALLALATVAVLTAGATATAFELLREPPPAPPSRDAEIAAPKGRADEPAAAPRAESPARVADPALDGDIAALAARVSELERRLLSERRPVEVEGDRVDATLALDAADPATRELVLAILADEQARRSEERELRRSELELAALDRRAAELALKVGLGQKQRAQLLEILIAENQQRDDARRSMRDGDFGPDAIQVMRDERQAIRSWKSDELVTRFGANVAEQIGKAEQEGRGRDAGRRRGRGGF